MYSAFINTGRDVIRGEKMEMMTSEQKRKALDRVIEEMAATKTLDEVKRLEARGYEHARGSNDRKDALRAAKQQAISRIKGEDVPMMAVSQMSAAELHEVSRIARSASINAAGWLDNGDVVIDYNTPEGHSGPEMFRRQADGSYKSEYDDE